MDGVPRAGVTNVIPAIIVSVSPNAMGVEPMVIGVEKFVSSSDNRIVPVFVANVLGTAICYRLLTIVYLLPSLRRQIWIAPFYVIP